MESFDRASVESALAVSVRAPSIHNTQPWLWELRRDGLALRADTERKLAVADPDGHSMRISCGAALTLAEYGLRAAGWQFRTDRLPDSTDPDLLALITPAGHAVADSEVAEVVALAALRHSDRRPFSAQQVAAELVEELRRAAQNSEVHAEFPDRPEQRVNLAVAVGWADRIERDDAEYIAEMNRWLRDPDVNPAASAEQPADGIPTAAVPHVAEGSVRHTEVPVRDFEVGVPGRQLIEQDVDERPLIAVLLTRSDTALEQLRAGESMMRLMLQAQRAGLACCPLSQAVDLVAFRSRLRTLMGWQGFPQMMLRLGYPVSTAAEQGITPRRRVADVLRLAPGAPD